jgi:Kef-type K+ transport system membrane component KefB
MWKEAVISAILPLAGMGLVILWKLLLKRNLSTEDYLVVLELLVATLTLTAAVWANDNDRRSPTARDVAAVVTAVVGIVALPIAALLVQKAYDPNQKHAFTSTHAWWANGIAVLVFFLAYFFTHLPS